MAEPKVNNACAAGINLDVFQGFKWTDNNKDGVPQVGEVKDALGAAANAELVARLVSAVECYSKLQALFGGVKKVPNCLEKLAEAKATIKKARRVTEDLVNPDDVSTAHGRLMNILEEPQAPQK